MVSSTSNVENVEVKTKYHYEYDNTSNTITISVALVDENGTETVDKMVGVPFVDENGDLDAVFDCDGEFILLSELKDQGMIENCGWFTNLFKKVAKAVKTVTNTVCGKIGAALTIAVPAVIGVVGAIIAAPIIPVIVVGTAAGAGIAAATAINSTAAQNNGNVDWETVGICAGVGAAVGAISSALAYKITSAIKTLFPKANPSTNVKSFDSYNAFKNEYGKASSYINNGEWHHIVEQQTVTKGINGASTVYNSQNTVAISKNLHHAISTYYSSYNAQYGMVFRNYINTLTYEEQYVKGLEILKMFAEKLGETIVWL